MKLKKVSINTALPGKSRARILVIYTGGTFGMSYDKEGVLVPFDFEYILTQLPTLKNLALEITAFSFTEPIDSSNISIEHWKLIGDIIYENYGEHDGFVVLHGTDTMAYTTSALSFMLEGLSKPVVCTGAQLPISEPRSDAREHLITALEIASATKDGIPLVPEVCIYFDYELLRGNRSKKVESMQFDAFDSGNYPALAKAGVKIDYNFAVIRPAQRGATLSLRSTFDTNIAILKLWPGIHQTVVRSILNVPDIKAVIIETYGSGNAPTLDWLIEEFKSAIDRGIILLNVSQCPGGRVLPGRYETSRRLQQIGVISGADMTTEAAVTKLMLLIGEYGIAKARELIGLPLAGELTA
ncbi:MAG TPA: asparaginase [Chryseolinea sp.]|nr:asparaginase [Chryseolinea sp.]